MLRYKTRDNEAREVKQIISMRLWKIGYSDMDSNFFHFFIRQNNLP